jgi:hypothetical protein
MVLMDREDWERLGGKKISVAGPGYAQIYMGGQVLLLHRWILGLTTGDGRIADHINRDKLDNRRQNLRVVTPAQSNLNRVTKPGKYGVGIKICRGKYQARVKRNGQVAHLGTWETLQEAQEARDAYLRLLGE